MAYSSEQFARFNTAIAESAVAWTPEEPIATDQLRGTRGMYYAAGRQLLNLVKERIPEQEEISAIRASTENTAVFAYTMALVARKHEIDQTELTRRMRSGQTFRTLAIAARVPNPISVKFESIVGMRSNRIFGNDADKAGYYRLGEEGFEFRNVDGLLARAIDESGNSIEFEDRLSGLCPGLVQGSVRAHLDAFVTIADRDPRLFSATLGADIVNGV
jgi:hypothetical protein